MPVYGVPSTFVAATYAQKYGSAPQVFGGLVSGIGVLLFC